MKIKHLIVLSLINLAFTFSSQATLMTLASDDANNYGDQWQGNGGIGFDDWHFNTDSAGGSAGGFLANKNNNGDLNHIASNPSDNAWGTYANGGGFNQFEAYRGFSSNSLTQAGDIFQLSFEHGAITQGGSVGFVLRNQNIHNAIGDYNQLSRFEFGFIGGGQHYSIFDGQGVIDTGIDYTDAGLNLTFTLLTPDLYQLDIFNAFDNSFIQSRNGSLNGSGSIDSVSLYNRDAELANAYFNSLSISQNVVAVPAPSTWLLLCLSLGVLLISNQRKLTARSDK
ncbi:MAG: PEP-CTERM sorting domain-containing protein [Colwellia sp.]|nr:PEP-CTERM sorting domain-containing protein [Colwellia sp.]MCW9081290.1 PEP-CTERM sorting domain-containing protein [Colwellia sp.]